MSSVAARPRVLARLTARPVGLTGVIAGTVALMVVSGILRSRALDSGFWIDEAISVGVSSHGFFDIPSVLRLDGSPPLYYLLLHLWMQAFGSTETATHALSLVFAILIVPAAHWVGRSLWGARTGWVAAILAAVSPYLTYYAQETRMYSMVALFGLLVAATFIHAFVARDRRYLPAFAIATALIIYSHNYGLFLAAATVIALALLWRLAAPDDRRPLLRDALLAYGGVALLYLPWVPTLIFQTLNTGAPGAERPGISELFGARGTLRGGATTGIALLLAAGAGLGTLLEERTTERGRRTLVLATITVGAFLIAFLVSQISPAFTNRYMSAFVGPLLLCAAIGLAHAKRLGIVGLVLVVAFWFDPQTDRLTTKSNVRNVAASIPQYVSAGDLVVSTHPEQLPLLAYYFPEGVRYATSMGPVEDPRVMDWRDAQDRLKAALPTKTIDATLARLSPGQELVLIQPIVRTGRWNAPWTSLVLRRVKQWEYRLDRDPRVRREAVVPVFGFDRLPKGVRVVVYRRLGTVRER